MCEVDLGIWREILIRLPAEALFRLGAVCKRWRTIISDPGFVKAHTNNQLSSNACNIILRNSTGPPFAPLYYFNLGDLDYETDEPQTVPVVPLSLTRGGLSSLRSLPVATCNGLLLTAPDDDDDDDDESDWEIRNPLTRERLKLPKPNIDANSKVVGYGLGFDSAVDDYKVVVIDYFLLNSKTRTHVYSLKSDLWKEIGNCPFDLSNTDQRRGVFLNGALHWLSSDENGIAVVVVGTESYRQLYFERGPTSTTQLEALSGCLFFTHRYIKNVVYSPYRNWDYKHIDAWVMSYDGGKEDSWLKFFSSHRDNEGVLRPVAYLKNKRRVFLQNDHQIFWLDFERSEYLKRVNIHAVCNLKRVNLHAEKSIISVQDFVGTLFRLCDCCGGRVASTQQKKNTGFSRLTFCVNGYGCPPYPKRHCYRLNSNWQNPSCNGGKEKNCASPFTPFDTLSHVPLDICREIFFHLPAKSLIRFRDVCSAWRAILDDPDFEEAYTNKQPSSSSDTNIIIRSSTGPPFYPLYSLNLDDLDFTDGLQRIAATPLDDTPRGFPCPPEKVASCNGLMLIPYENTYEIWNPLTQERLKLPQPNIKENNKVGTGLGYDYVSDDYKAVVLHHLFENRNKYTTQTHVYSLRTDSWRNLGDCLCDPKGLGVFFSGALHWILPSSEWYVARTILSLDLETESYWEMELPLSLNRKRPFLSVLGDCLAFSYYSDAHFVVWVMEDYEDEEDYSWTQLFSIDGNYYKIGTELRPVVYMKDKTQVFLQDDEFGFYVFDLERKSMKKVCIHGQLRKNCAQFIPGTIFRLRDKCGATGRRRRITIMRRKKKMKLSFTELYFCVRDAKSWGFSHDDCYSLDPDWDNLSTEDEDSTFKG